MLTGVHGDVRLFGGVACNGLVSQLDASGDGTYTVMGNCQTAVEGSTRQLAFAISGANPFHGSTALRYSVSKRVPVRIDVYSVMGQRMRTLVDREAEPGTYTVPLRMRDEASGRTLPVGVYLVRLTAGKEARNLRVVALQ